MRSGSLHRRDKSGISLECQSSTEGIRRHPASIYGLHISYGKISSILAEASKRAEVKYLYVEADEDHIALQYKEKRGDIRRFKGHADNGQIVKLVYVHEGYADNGKDLKRKELKNVVYFRGLYRGKDNEKLWKEVKEYIEKQYETDEIEKIYFQSDGGDG